MLLPEYDRLQNNGKEKKLGGVKFNNPEEEETTVAFGFCSTYIDSIGYDAQRALLAVKMIRTGRVRWYADVPEEVWYRFRESASPDLYYRRYICGHFRETAVCCPVHDKRKTSLDKRRKKLYPKNENDSQ